MQILDSRLRPPIPSLTNTWLYDTPNMKFFAKQFGDSYLGESAIAKDMDMLLEEMRMLEIRGLMTFRRTGIENMNEEGKEILEKYPDYFYGMCGLDVCMVEESLKLMDQYVVNGPYIGICIEPQAAPPGYQGVEMDDEKIFPIYEKAEKLGIPVSCNVSNSIPPGNSVSSERIHNVLSTFPKLKLMMLHGAWPKFRDLTDIMWTHENLFVSADSYIMKMPGWKDYVDAGNYLLQDQILFGSSYPLHSLEHVVDFYLNEAGFRNEVLPKIMHDNCARFLGLTDGYPKKEIKTL